MKRLFLIVILSIVGVYAVKAQLISPTSYYKEGFSIGLEKSKNFFLGYGKNGFNGRVKQTLTADKARYQYIRVDGGYTYKTGLVDLSCEVFYTSDWQFENYNIGSQITFTSSVLVKYGNLAVRYVPYYDKELKFNHGWSVSGKVNITKDISFVAEYGSVPDFRIAYNRLYMGAMFNIKNLSVYPVLEIPLYENEIHLSHSQMVVSMCYTFASKVKER